ncbi:hypothetical protein Gogos_007949 [Gossypium gossypioides]|uniref:Uncharacterized protein n=1 Tax=Gossypium gossypioides TaxID=34282 RepID=A0A7J9CA47_GOSGO|nr:hypothetical protein [Gossypium gossypioides]
MWRWLLIPQLKTLATVPRRSPSKTPLLQFKCSVSPLPSSSLLTRHLAAESADTAVKKRVEDVMPIATGHEREELAAELDVMFPLPVSDSNCRGKKIIEDVNNPVGPFGTYIYPFEFGPLFDGVTPFFLLLETGNVDLYEIVSDALTFDENAEDEHDVVWFWLEKGKLHECPVCSQYFVVLEDVRMDMETIVINCNSVVPIGIKLE